MASLDFQDLDDDELIHAYGDLIIGAKEAEDY
jgi:hypothetical protein